MVSNTPIRSAHLDFEEKEPNSMFDSFEQEEKKLVEQLAASEKSSQRLLKDKGIPGTVTRTKFT